MTDRAAKTSPQKATKRHVVVVSGIAVLALCVAVVVAVVVWGKGVTNTQYLVVNSSSMAPTLQMGDRVTVDLDSFSSSPPARGDIVAFRSPPSNACGTKLTEYLIKRIVGLPGETISSNGNEILIDGHALKQDWGHTEPLGIPISTQVIAPKHYFLMGDSQSDSCDSRFYGQIPRSSIIGKVVHVSVSSTVN